MRKTYDILEEAKLEVFEETKIPHSTSRPVIRKFYGHYYLASFVFLYTAEDIKNGTVDRPTLWIQMDIDTGKVYGMQNTVNYEFSKESYSKKYPIRSKSAKLTKDEERNAYALLDEVREELILTKKVNKEKYEKYMEMILHDIPESYKNFYKDLSKL